MLQYKSLLQYKPLTGKVLKILVLMLAISAVIASCGPAATPPPPPTNIPAATAVPATAAPQPTTAAPTTAAPTTAAAKAFKIGVISDVGGVDDKSFNAAAVKGLEDSKKDFGLDAASTFLQSKQQTDYAKNIQEFTSQKFDGIITVGFLMGVATADGAKANPDVKFAIVDYSYPDCFGTAVEGTDCGSAKPLPNALGITFKTEEAAFQAGYLAAGMSKTKKVGTYGGLNIPPVVDFMVGFEAGIKYWNTKHNDTVALLGWSTSKNDGTFAADFNDAAKGKQITESLIDEGADIVLPVAGQTGLGTFTAAKEKGILAIGVDVDQCVSVPDACPVLLTSIRKNIDVAVHDAIGSMVAGKFAGGTSYSGTLANNGVSIAPYNQLDSKVPAELKAEVEAIKADIVAGKIDIRALAAGTGSTTPPAKAFKIGVISDVGGVDDKSFNAAAVKGLEDSKKDFGLDAASTFLQSKQQTDYAKNIQEFTSQKFDGIITVGFLMGVATADGAKANPDVKFAIVDYSYPDCFGTAVEGTDCGSAKPLPNALGITFKTEEAAFQAGYLAAGMSKTKKVGTYGGLNIPPVVDFMVGFEAGIKYWNTKHNDTVALLGWSTSKNDGTFAADFNDAAKGKQITESLIDEGADIVLPVAGQTGLGTFTAAKEKGILAIGVDVDQCVSVPDACPVLLTSIRKNIDVAVHDAIGSMVAGKFAGGTSYSGTLANNGVSIAPYNQLDSKVPAELKAEVEAIKADIVAGKIDIRALAAGTGSTTPPAKAFKIGVISDVGGVDDKSFNAAAVKGLEDSKKDFGLDAASTFLQSKQQTDYAKNIQEFTSQKFDGIITVGFLMGVATADGAKANPDVKFAIVDYSYPDCFGTAVEGTDCGSAKPLPNALGITFKTEEAAFQAGYLAAGMSKTKKVGTYGGLNIPPVVDFMVGFEAGIKYWNTKHNDTVALLGWSTSKNDGTFAADFNDAAKGKQITESLIDEGADIVLPVAGQTGLGTFTAAKEKGILAIGVDVDQCVSVPDACPVLLTSIRKNIDVAVHDAIGSMVAGKFAGGTSYSGTLANNGVSIAPFHDQDAKVSAELKAELEAIKADIIAGKIDIRALAAQ